MPPCEDAVFLQQPLVLLDQQPIAPLQLHDRRVSGRGWEGAGLLAPSQGIANKHREIGESGEEKAFRFLQF